ncbi:hypothetical protein L484_015369 [Morus notabilis]|uniref:Uncharacterized protein n=1 Tax=Morus notabilis TaxID=981085 RepID=W9RC42_9ROSA|nr:hypothetical protein L484_015369 [Morus notabilis]
MGRDILEPRKRRRTPNQNLQPEEEKDPSLSVPPVRARGEKQKKAIFVRADRERESEIPQTATAKKLVKPKRRRHNRSLNSQVVGDMKGWSHQN